MRNHKLGLLLAALALAAGVAAADSNTQAPMQRYVIERDIAGAGNMTHAELQAAAAKSNAVLHDLGPDIQWVQSYVTGDKLYCVYNAKSEALIRKHAEISGFPANRVTRVVTVIDPTTTAGQE